MIRKSWQHFRKRLLWDVMDSLGELRQELASLHRNVREVERSLHSTQLEINHNQNLLLTELKDRVKNSGTIMLNERELLVKIFSGLKMYLDPRDVAITPHLALDGIWEHRITSAWLRILRSDSTVLDVGANNGYYGALAAQKAGRQAKVFLFEANPHFIPYIERTLAVNFLSNQSTVVNAAVAGAPGELTLHVLKDYIGSSTVFPDERVRSYIPNKWKVETQEAITVKAITIDDYCSAHKISEVNQIIMDIEGFEDKAYIGMRQIIAASHDITLFVEFTRAAYADPKAFYKQMLSDFGNVYTLDDNGNFTIPSDSSFEAIIGDAEDWVMPVFSKRPDLAKR